jgi:hypothetical protein
MVAGGIVAALMLVASLGHIGLAAKIVPPPPAFIPPLPGAKS